MKQRKLITGLVVLGLTLGWASAQQNKDAEKESTETAEEQVDEMTRRPKLPASSLSDRDRLQQKKTESTKQPNPQVPVMSADKATTLEDALLRIAELEKKLEILTISSNGDVELQVDRNLTIEASRGIEIKAGEDMVFEAGKDIDLEAMMNLKLESSVNVTQKAGAQMKIESGAAMDLKSGIIKINGSKPAARMGDTIGGNKITTGSSTVLIGP